MDFLLELYKYPFRLNIYIYAFNQLRSTLNQTQWSWHEDLNRWTFPSWNYIIVYWVIANGKWERGHDRKIKPAFNNVEKIGNMLTQERKWLKIFLHKIGKSAYLLGLTWKMVVWSVDIVLEWECSSSFLWHLSSCFWVWIPGLMRTWWQKYDAQRH